MVITNFVANPALLRKFFNLNMEVAEGSKLIACLVMRRACIELNHEVYFVTNPALLRKFCNLNKEVAEGSKLIACLVLAADVLYVGG